MRGRAHCFIRNLITILLVQCVFGGLHANRQPVWEGRTGRGEFKWTAASIMDFKWADPFCRALPNGLMMKRCRLIMAAIICAGGIQFHGSGSHGEPHWKYWNISEIRLLNYSLARFCGKYGQTNGWPIGNRLFLSLCSSERSDWGIIYLIWTSLFNLLTFRRILEQLVDTSPKKVSSTLKKFRSILCQRPLFAWSRL